MKLVKLTDENDKTRPGKPNELQWGEGGQTKPLLDSTRETAEAAKETP